ncbi:MAG: undecaprenyl-diphosphate phosphatase, partial [Planctomycetota bacterium]
MIFVKMLVLAVVQGVTEFLPVSSSGHVLVAAAVFEQLGHPIGHDELTLNIVLHLGTLGAILAFYRRRIGQLLTRNRRVIGLLLVGTLPAAAIGILLPRDAVQSVLLAGFMFPLTGLMLLASARIKSGTLTCGQLTYGKALLIGAFQALAILPGVSRSGATIVAGLAC